CSRTLARRLKSGGNKYSSRFTQGSCNSHLYWRDRCDSSTSSLTLLALEAFE
ncbi:hypothetical protein BaRGS_00012355, partial [Batillaria attramentaria]